MDNMRLKILPISENTLVNKLMIAFSEMTPTWK